jgi:hypothetical protein
VLSLGQLGGNQMYWPSYDYAPPRLMRAGFDDAEPALLMPISRDFAAGPGYILTQEDVWSPDYQYAGKDLVLRDDSGCRAVRGPTGTFMAGAALEADVAYWASSASRGGTGEPLEIGINRIDLRSGALSRLNTPDIAPSDRLRIVGHDATRLFLYDDSTLFSVQKP